jgi:hypothetical protein
MSRPGYAAHSRPHPQATRPETTGRGITVGWDGQGAVWGPHSSRQYRAVDCGRIEAHTCVVAVLKRVPRRGYGLALVGLIAIAGLTACGQQRSSSAGPLPVTVTSVTGTFTPYNPTLSSGGLPAEEVGFTVGGSPTGPFLCDVQVRYSGRTVGHTSISASPPGGNPRTVQEAIEVTISRAAFAGTPADAQVTCHRSSSLLPTSTTTTREVPASTATVPASTTTKGSSIGTLPVPTSPQGVPPPQAGPAKTRIVHNLVGSVCTVTQRPGSSEGAPMTPPALPSQPVAVDAVRIPGLNDPTCQSDVVTASGTPAGQLAADVNAAQEIAPGTSLFCPDDDGHGVDLVFRYAEPSEGLVVSVGLSGCLIISGLASDRRTSQAVTADLKSFVPSTWF